MGGSADSTIPATQVITYTVPTGGLPDCVNDGLGLVRSADGFKGAYNGLHVEDEKIGVWIFHWESTAKRDAFLADPAHAAMLMAVKTLTDARTDDGATIASQLQVSFPSIAAAVDACSAQITEIAVGTLKESADADEYERLLDSVVTAFAAVESTKGAVWGKAASRNPASRPKYVLVVGWESEEAYEASKPNQSGKELHEKICALVDYESDLVRLERRD